MDLDFVEAEEPSTKAAIKNRNRRFQGTRLRPPFFCCRPYQPCHGHPPSVAVVQQAAVQQAAESPLCPDLGSLIPHLVQQAAVQQPQTAEGMVDSGRNRALHSRRRHLLKNYTLRSFAPADDAAPA